MQQDIIISSMFFSGLLAEIYMFFGKKIINEGITNESGES